MPNRNISLMLVGSILFVALATVAWVPPSIDITATVALARSGAPLGIPGTDPQALSAAIDRLQKAQQSLALAQKTPQESALIKHLYPIAFLRSLSALEAARQELLEQPTASAARAYIAALQIAVTQRSKDLDAFTAAFAQAVGANVNISHFGGLMSRNSEMRTLFALQDDAARVEKRVQDSVAYAQSSTKFCADIPTLSIPTTSLAAFAPTQRTQEVSTIWDTAHGSGTARTFFTLDRSVCAATLPGPYHLALGTRTVDNTPIRTLSFADEIYFVDTDKVQAPFWQFARSNLNIRYLPVTPFSYYACPLIGIDMGTMLALERVREFSQTAFSDTPESQRAADELALMYARRTAGLEYIIADITHVTTLDINSPAGERINTSARYMFLTHSAFPTFFRIGATSDDVLSPLYTQTDTPAHQLAAAREKAGYTTYSTLRTIEERQTLVDDIATYLRFENRLVPNAPNTTPADTRPK